MNSHILVSVHDWKPDKFIEVFLYCTPSACHQQPACADKTMCYIIACPPFPYRPTLTDACSLGVSQKPRWKSLLHYAKHFCCCCCFFIIHRQREVQCHKDAN